jgi:hypothetical protein
MFADMAGDETRLQVIFTACAHTDQDRHCSTAIEISNSVRSCGGCEGTKPHGQNRASVEPHAFLPALPRCHALGINLRGWCGNATARTGIFAQESVMDRIEDRIRARAHHLFEAAGRPQDRTVDDYMSEASELIAIEESQRTALKPNPLKDEEARPYGEPIEPTLAVENEGEAPSLTDQSEGVPVPGFDKLQGD